jgi:hypothetical protein
MTRDDDHDEALELDALPDRFGDDARVCSCAECTEWRARYMPVPLICGGGSSDHVLGGFARGGFIPGPGSTRSHWRGWTARVGLRKSRLHFDAVRMRRDVRQDWAGDDMADVAAEWWDRQRLTFTEREADRNAEEGRIGLLQILSDEQAAQIREHGHLAWPRPDDSALEALADRMVAKRRPACEGGLYGAPTDCKCATCEPTGRVGGAPRPCCHTTGPLHHPACQERP